MNLFNTQYMMLSLVFSSAGLGYMVYGKRQKHFMALCCGLGLMFYTGFVSTLMPILLIGALLLVLPFVIRF